MTADPWLNRILRHAQSYRAACRRGDQGQARAQYLGLIHAMWDVDLGALPMLEVDQLGPSRNGASHAPSDAAPPNDRRA